MEYNMSKILIIITGGIASYKSLHLIRLLKDTGHNVQPVMTKNACEFITPLSVSTLAGKPVRTELFDLNEESNIDHISLSRDADLIVVVPTTANFIAKINCGLADDLASTLILGSNRPVLIAPAMNPVMWQNPATQNNIANLKKNHQNIHFINPSNGKMACGEVGAGRLADPELIFTHIQKMLGENTTTSPTGELSGKSFAITVGGTMESIDPVRVITNRSSGIQGFAIAESLIAKGAKVHAIVGTVSIPIPSGIIVHKVESADEMLEATKKICIEGVDCAIFCAAVSDYKVKNKADKKIKKSANGLTLEFEENPDILKTICMSLHRPKVVIGFAAETENTVSNAMQKISRKNCDMIVANTVCKDTFGSNKSHAYIIDKYGNRLLKSNTKKETAEAIVSYITEKIC